jgi:hypothetical protein
LPFCAQPCIPGRAPRTSVVRRIALHCEYRSTAKPHPSPARSPSGVALCRCYCYRRRLSKRVRVPPVVDRSHASGSQRRVQFPGRAVRGDCDGWLCGRLHGLRCIVRMANWLSHPHTSYLQKMRHETPTKADPPDPAMTFLVQPNAFPALACITCLLAVCIVPFGFRRSAFFRISAGRVSDFQFSFGHLRSGPGVRFCAFCDFSRPFRFVLGFAGACTGLRDGTRFLRFFQVFRG